MLASAGKRAVDVDNPTRRSQEVYGYESVETGGSRALTPPPFPPDRGAEKKSNFRLTGRGRPGSDSASSPSPTLPRMIDAVFFTLSISAKGPNPEGSFIHERCPRLFRRHSGVTSFRGEPCCPYGSLLSRARVRRGLRGCEDESDEFSSSSRVIRDSRAGGGRDFVGRGPAPMTIMKRPTSLFRMLVHIVKSWRSAWPLRGPTLVCALRPEDPHFHSHSLHWEKYFDGMGPQPRVSLCDVADSLSYFINLFTCQGPYCPLLALTLLLGNPKS